MAIFVLYVFLRNGSTTFIIALAIPISIIATFGLLFFNNLTLNQMSFGGLALGIGLIVDNAIVVLENIFRHLQEGKERKEAARLGASEVSMAITASTLTSVIVFLPMVFASGITGTLLILINVIKSYRQRRKLQKSIRVVKPPQADLVLNAE